MANKTLEEQLTPGRSAFIKPGAGVFFYSEDGVLYLNKKTPVVGFSQVKVLMGNLAIGPRIKIEIPLASTLTHARLLPRNPDFTQLYHVAEISLLRSKLLCFGFGKGGFIATLENLRGENSWYVFAAHLTFGTDNTATTTVRPKDLYIQSKGARTHVAIRRVQKGGKTAYEVKPRNKTTWVPLAFPA